MAPVFINLILFAALLFGLARLQSGTLSLSARVFVGLVLGTLFGTAVTVASSATAWVSGSATPAAPVRNPMFLAGPNLTRADDEVAGRSDTRPVSIGADRPPEWPAP